ncbi:GNVR domain-containing protein [Synechococcus sp. PCC 6312]|uniref:GumC family protein n=1 Tax=Synechococcus sp. (strain ATCC 27167 / PCC 6312) TaxID=195253 RepID=UPI000300BA6C|nr:GNVR domain-containing protein [Synechococcus sp. PCC 6312]
MTQEKSLISENFLVNKPKEGDVDIQSYLGLVRRHWLGFTLTFSSVLVLSGLYAVTRIPVYEANGLIWIQKQNQASALIGIQGVPGGDLSSVAGNPLNTQIAIFRTDNVLEKAAKLFNIDSTGISPSTSASKLGSGMSVSQVPRTDLLNVSFRSPDQAVAVKAVDNLMSSFIANSIRLSQIQKTAAREFIESQLPNAEKNLIANLNKLTSFKQDFNIVSLDAQTGSLIQELANLQQSIQTTQVQLVGLQNTQVGLEALLGVSAVKANQLKLLAESAGIQASVVELQKTEAELTALSSRYRQNHPEVLLLKRQRDAQSNALQNQISELLGNQENSVNQSPAQIQLGSSTISLLTQVVTNEFQIKSLIKQVDLLKSKIDEKNKVVEQLPSLQRRLLQLQLEYDVSSARYSALLKSLQDAQLSENQDVGNAVIVQQAKISPIPVSVDPERIIFLGGVFGLLIGFGIAFLLEQLDNFVHSENEIQEIFASMPTLATIPVLYESEKKVSPSSG